MTIPGKGERRHRGAGRTTDTSLAVSPGPSWASHPDATEAAAGHFPVARSLTVAIGPVVIEPVPHLLVDGGHGLHIALPPLPSQILGLHLEQLQHVQLHHGLLHLQGPLQDGGRLEHHQHLGGGRREAMLRAEINPAPSSTAVPPGLRAGWPAVTVFLRLKSFLVHMTSTKVSWLKLGKSQAKLDGWSPELWVILESEESY